MIIFLKKYLFPIFWIIITGGLYFMILFTSDEIRIWPPEFTADGLSLFVKIFSIPLYFFAAGIPIYGIILTIKRIDQTDKQYRELMYSSYSNHLEDFIESLKKSNPADIHILSNAMKENEELLYRRWHKIWFGNENTFNHFIKDSAIKEVKNLLQSVSKIREQVLHDQTIAVESLDQVKNQLFKVGFNFSNDIIHSIQHKGTSGEFQSSIKLLINIPKLSGEQIFIDEYIRQLID